MKFKELIKNVNRGFLKKLFIIALIVGAIYLLSSKSLVNNEGKSSKWNNLSIKSANIFITNNWLEYSPTDTYGKFTIAFPNNWTINGSVFSNQDGEKIAELSPGLVGLKPNQSCFDSEWNGDYAGESQFISLNNIRIGSLEGKLLIEKTEAWNGTPNDEYWYPHFYCLSNGKNAFVMTFYEKTIESNNEKLYDRILSTLKIE